MNDLKTSVLSNALIWFGAGVSIAEILTGTFIATLGIRKGLAAIIIGHLIGCALLYFAGLIGAYTEKSSMETVKISFGQKGSLFFSIINVIQLIGWTAIMIYSGATAANTIFAVGLSIWSIIIGILIIIWIILGVKNLGKIKALTIASLFILTLVLSALILKGDVSTYATEGISFTAAIELSIAMPLSWLPLISDYTRELKQKRIGTFASVLAYFVVSCWMYYIGLKMALYTGERDIAIIMLKSGLTIAGLLIIVLSTVTTTFLDAYSAGVSSVTINKNINEKTAGIVVTIIGLVLAVFFNVSSFENFLYLIGSVFAPMIAILIADYFLFRIDNSTKNIDYYNFGIWIIGFACYRYWMNMDTIIGSTIPTIVIIFVLCFIKNKFNGGKVNA